MAKYLIPSMKKDFSAESYADKKMMEELEKMGYPKEIVKNALLITRNGQIEKAVEWIENHSSESFYSKKLEVSKFAEFKPITEYIKSIFQEAKDKEVPLKAFRQIMNIARRNNLKRSEFLR